jgi:hypothetical protein
MNRCDIKLPKDFRRRVLECSDNISRHPDFHRHLRRRRARPDPHSHHRRGTETFDAQPGHSYTFPSSSSGQTA